MPENETQETQNLPDGALNTGSQDDKKPVAYTRFAEVINEKNQLKAELDKIRKDAEDARNASLAEQGRYKEISEKQASELATLKTASERAQALEAAITANNEKRIARIPEKMRGLVPIEFTPETLSAWLDKNEALLITPPAPQTDAGAQGTAQKPVQLTDNERELARLSGMSAEEYAKWKRKPETT
jgi:phage I-like protein